MTLLNRSVNFRWYSRTFVDIKRKRLLACTLHTHTRQLQKLALVFTLTQSQVCIPQFHPYKLCMPKKKLVKIPTFLYVTFIGKILFARLQDIHTDWKEMTKLLQWKASPAQRRVATRLLKNNLSANKSLQNLPHSTLATMRYKSFLNTVNYWPCL